MRTSPETVSAAAVRCGFAVLAIVRETAWVNLSRQRMRVHALAEQVAADGLPDAGDALHAAAADRSLDVDGFKAAIGGIALGMLPDC